MSDEEWDERDDPFSAMPELVMLEASVNTEEDENGGRITTIRLGLPDHETDYLEFCFSEYHADDMEYLLENATAMLIYTMNEYKRRNISRIAEQN